MGNLSQSNRMGALKTPLGEDALVLKSFSGGEGLSELFEFDVEALSEQENINFDPALGQSCTIKLKTHNDKERFFCGILARAQWAGRDPEYLGDTEKYFAYRLVLRPWFWLLAHRADCRIFLDKKVKKLSRKCSPMPDFPTERISSSAERQLRQDQVLRAISRNRFRIRFTADGAVWNLLFLRASGRSAHHGARRLAFLAQSDTRPSQCASITPATAGYNRQEQQIYSWVSDRQFRTGKVEFNDYDYLKPPKNLRAHKEAAENYNRGRVRSLRLSRKIR